MQTGRKTKYSPQMQSALCKWLRKGCSFKDACAMEGISYETFRTWQSEKSAFSVAIKKAEAECKVARIQTVLKASDKSWQAAAWWLERRCPEEYGKVPKEKSENVVTIEELEEAGREQDEQRYKTIEEARAAWAKEEEAEERCRTCVVCNPPA
jgi:hypothetical protein